MKYLKIFEDWDRTYKLQDFLDIPYWRYKNSGVNTIMKVEFLDNDKNGSKWNSDYKIIFFSLINNTFHEIIWKNDFLYQIMNLDIPEKILRPATDEEIDLFKDNLLTRKFNI